MATTPITSSMPEAQPEAKISPIGRVFGVLFSPKATYEDIARKPNWLVPVALFTVMGIIMGLAMNQRMNWREYVAQQIEKSPQAAQLSAEQKEQQISIGAKIAPYSVYLGTVIVPIVGVLIVAGIMLGAYNILAGAGVNFGTSLSIVGYAYVPLLLSSVLFLVVLFLKPVGTIDLENPVATNLAAFLPEEAPKWLMAMGKNIDIFLIWVTLLMAIGFSAASPRKLKGSKAYTIAFGMLIVWIICRAGWAFIFS